MYADVSEDFLAKLSEPSRHFAMALFSGENQLDIDVVTASINTGTCGGSSIAVGCAFASMADFTIWHTGIQLEGRELQAKLGLLLDDGTYEYIPFGYWTIQKPDTQGDRITFRAVDRIAAKMNAPYTTSLTYPATIAAILSELSTATGVTINCSLQTTQTLATPITGVTQRGALATIAATLLANAWCDRNGEVQITAFNNSAEAIEVNYDYVKPQPTMDEINSVVEGVKVYTAEERTDSFITSGTGHMVEVTDPYMSQTVLNAVAENVVGFSYDGGSVQFMGNPLLDPSDTIYFIGGTGTRESDLITHANENIITHNDEPFYVVNYADFSVPCMEIVQFFDGGLTTTVTAPGTFEKTEETYSTGAITAALERNAIASANAQDAADTAQETAETAQEAADTAQETAETAQTTADSALTAAGTAQTTANNAVTLANGKNKIYYQTTAPTGSGLTVGDLWFDTGTGNSIHEYKSTGWVLRQLGQGSIAANSITANELAANTITANQIAANTITGAQIAANTITATQIAASTITAAELASSAVTADKIAAGAITATKIAASAITTEKIAANAITGAKIAANTITADDIKAGTITSTEIATDTIKATNIAAGAITASELAANAVTAAKIDAGAITTEKIAANAITSAKIAANTITADDIKAGTITGTEIASDTIRASNIAAGAITTSELAASAVTAAKIDAGAITTEKIAANAITSEKIAANTITADDIKAGTITGTEIAADTITTSNIAAGAITTTELAASAVTATKINAGAITSEKIAANAITSEKIAANTITADDIKAGTITGTEIAADTITTANIAAGAITATELAADSVTSQKINVESLEAVSANMGELTAGAIKSTDYRYTSGNYTTAGMIIDIDNQVIRAEEFAVIDGALYATDAVISGTITAEHGSIKGDLVSSGISATNITTGTLDVEHRISAGSIEATKLNVETLEAVSANMGELTAGLIKSSDYRYTSGNYAAAGMIVDISNQVIRTQDFAIVNGELFARDATISGTITATSGTIGGCVIDNSGTLTVKNANIESLNGEKVVVDYLSQIKNNIGTITAGVLKSSDYSYSSGSYSSAGMIIDLNNKIYRTPKTAILSDGSIYSTNVNLTGAITAKSLSVTDYITITSTVAAISQYTFTEEFTTGSWNYFQYDYYDVVPPSTTYPLMSFNRGLMVSGNVDAGSNRLIGQTIDSSQIYTHVMCADQGLRIDSFSGTSGSNGYILMCRLIIRKTYVDYPIEIRYLARSRKSVETITIRFYGNDHKDPNMDLFTYFCQGQDSTSNAYIVKESTSTWAIYIAKASAYSVIAPISVAKAVSSPDIEWDGSQVSSLPTGYTQATKVG